MMVETLALEHLVLALRAIEAEGLPALLATIWDLVISGRTMAEAGISYVSPFVHLYSD